MRRLLAILLLAAGTAGAQEGFPLDGTWRGERQAGNQAEDRAVGEARSTVPVTIVMVMQWDGQKISGVINPGPKSIPIADAQLVPEGWKVKLSARTAAGEPISFEGTLVDIGAYDRKIDGTWTEGGRQYRVRMVRE